MQTISLALKDWSKQYDDRTKLQHSYVALAILVLVAGGLIGLVNYDLGQMCLFISSTLIALFVVNSVAWALLQSFVVSRLSKRSTTKK